MIPVPAPALAVRTAPIDAARRLVPLVDPTAPTLWRSRDLGLAAIGERVRLEFSGPGRFRAAAAAWADLVARAEVEDEVGSRGTGLVAFGAFAFDDASAATSVLIVPEVVVGSSGGRSWLTTIGHAGAPAGPGSLRPRGFGTRPTVRFGPGAQSPAGYRQAVRDAVGRIAAGDASKIVVARDLHGTLPAGADLRPALDRLARDYQDCWTFAVDGLVGASPETLLRVENGAISARVLAGTTARGTDDDEDRRRVERLLASGKDRGEHELAVASVLSQLGPSAATLEAARGPFPLRLPNVWHLATDLTGTLAPGVSALDALGAVHPTAAVAGTGTAEAVAAIRELEPFDRGRFAGPVGWLGADGDGDWAIALRCAQVRGDEITAYAGCGIVEGSDPDAELAETTMKLRPIVDAFG